MNIVLHHRPLSQAVLWLSQDLYSLTLVQVYRRPCLLLRDSKFKIDVSWKGKKKKLIAFLFLITCNINAAHRESTSAETNTIQFPCAESSLMYSYASRYKFLETLTIKGLFFLYTRKKKQGQQKRVTFFFY